MSVDVVVVLLMIVVVALCLHDVMRGHRRRTARTAAAGGTTAGTSAARPAQHRQLVPGGSVEVVSGPALQGALAAAAAGPDRVLDAALVPTPGDPAGGEAVRVEVAGQLVGHLDAELGPRYRQALQAVPGGGAWGSCAARVEGGGDRSPVLVLDLADPEVAVPAA